MSIKLFIGTEQTDFDEKFNVVYSIADIRNQQLGNNNKTYPLTLPLTKTNKRLVKFIQQIDVKSEVSAVGRLYLNEILIISGTVTITNLDDYKVSLTITSDDWIEVLKDRRLTALDLSASDHALTHASVEDSWTASYPVYRYPMIDFGPLASGETGEKYSKGH